MSTIPPKKDRAQPQYSQRSEISGEYEAILVQSGSSNQCRSARPTGRDRCGDAERGRGGFRRNHAKGVCVTGWFESNGQAAVLSKAAVFKPGRIPVVGRFALAGACLFRRMRLRPCAAWRCASCHPAARNGARA